MIIMLTTVMPRMVMVVTVVVAVVIALARFDHTTRCHQDDGEDGAGLRDT